jgi:hypothetical protein
VAKGEKSGAKLRFFRARFSSRSCAFLLCSREREKAPAPTSGTEYGSEHYYLRPELGIIGDNSTNRQRINRSTLSIVGYRLALEMALSVCRLKTKSDDGQIELSVRTINRYSRMIV